MERSSRLGLARKRCSNKHMEDRERTSGLAATEDELNL